MGLVTLVIIPAARRAESWETPSGDATGFETPTAFCHDPDTARLRLRVPPTGLLQDEPVRADASSKWPERAQSPMVCKLCVCHTHYRERHEAIRAVLLSVTCALVLFNTDACWTVWQLFVVGTEKND